MDIRRAHRRCGPEEDRIGVELLAIGQFPYTGVMRGLAAHGFDQCDLPVERGIDGVRHNLRGLRVEIASNIFFLRAAGNRLDHNCFFRSDRAKCLQLGEGLVQREIGRDDPKSDVMHRNLGVIIEHFSHLREAGKVCVRIRPGLDRLLAVEEVRNHWAYRPESWLIA